MKRCTVVGCVSPMRARGLCNKHYLRAWNDGTLDLVAPLPTVAERFWSNVEIVDGGCWNWTASRDPSGYGRFRDASGVVTTATLAHRISYEFLVGPIPDGLHIDHLCRNTSCVNPAHLEPVTPAENTRRGMAGAWNTAKTHCKNGHPFDEENTAVYYGKRACRTCRREWGRKYDAARNQSA